MTKVMITFKGGDKVLWDITDMHDDGTTIITNPDDEFEYAVVDKLQIKKTFGGSGLRCDLRRYERGNQKK